MSNEESELSVRITKFVTRLGILSSQIEHSESEARDASLSLARSIVHRHNVLASMLSMDDKARRDLIHNCLTYGAQDESALLHQVDDLSAFLPIWKMDLESLKDELVSIWGEFVGLIRFQDGELRRERGSVASIIARQKEHAINDPTVRDAVWGMTDGKCWYCDVNLVRSDDGGDTSATFCVDHLVAKANGGPDHLANYVPSCRRCNSSKCAKSYVEFKRWRAERERLTVIDGGPEKDGEAA